ncbi:hypothetical protein [Bradyrhizobium neotropicale]|uniref:Uncharacterized protein n=1 Tax=Bradyrhizobium neotropicale TaxID=1497615 RepID=A0A176ZJS3_9BRAD|nr:hypothetical protein [Bradyrhizobium neotropicale]OAF20132.1 hypothetical protein AXW67_33700 [Bradyrhizobium neotropicale]
MRQMISGLVAAAAVMFVGAAPAMACGFSPCAPVVPVYTGCNTGCGSWGYGAGYGGWGFEQLAEPATQYYYVNQGPTYTGPGAFAPYPTYREDAVVAPANYGYGYGYRAAYPYHRPYYRPYRYGYGPRYGYLPRAHYGYGARYGYRPAPYYYGGRRVLRRYY